MIEFLILCFELTRCCIFLFLLTQCDILKSAFLNADTLTKGVLSVSLIIKEIKEVKQEKTIDLARFESDKETLLLEFAKVKSINEENGELEEIEIRSRLRMPIEYAASLLLQLAATLVEHEVKFKTGYGIPLEDNMEEDK